MRQSVTAPSLLPWPNPRWKENPYQKILYEGLSRNGVEIRPTPPAFSLLPYVPRCDWLHLNWPETLFADPRPSKRASRFSRFARTVQRLKRRGTRIVWTLHNEFPHDAPDREFHRGANEALCELADLIHVHFPQAVAVLEEEYGVARGKVHVMQHPHYGDHYGEPLSLGDARRGLGIDQRAQVILIFGYLRRYKGIETALDSFLKTEDPSFRLVVAGKAEDEETVGAVRLAAAKDPRIILRLGHVAPSEVMPLFAAANAFLLPSRHFFTSGSLMLALTYGLPVMAAPINHAATFTGRPFFNPWEPATDERLTQLMNSLPEWLGSVRIDEFERVWKEWSAESLTAGLTQRLRG